MSSKAVQINRACLDMMTQTSSSDISFRLPAVKLVHDSRAKDLAFQEHIK